MATKRKKPAPTPQKNIEELLNGVLPDDAEEDLYTFLDEIGPSISTVDIFRLNRDGSRPHIDRVTLDVLKEDVYGFLRAHGAGRYLLQFKSADRSIRKTKTIEVAGAVTPNGSPATQAAPFDHVTFLREQAARQDTMLLALIANMGKGAAPDLSFLSGVLKPPDMMPMVTLMTAILGKKDSNDGVALAQTIVKMSRDLAPEGSREDTWLTVAKEVGGRVVDALGGAIRQPAPPLLPAGNPPEARIVSTPAATPETTGGNTMVTRENFADYIRQGLTYLKTKAASGKDVEIIVDFMIENAEEPHWTAIVGAIEQGATFDNLLQFDPEIGQTPALRAWFQKLYDELRNALSEPLDTGGKGRDLDHTATNAGAGPEGPKPPGPATPR